MNYEEELRMQSILSLREAAASEVPSLALEEEIKRRKSTGSKFDQDVAAILEKVLAEQTEG